MLIKEETVNIAGGITVNYTARVMLQVNNRNIRMIFSTTIDGNYYTAGYVYSQADTLLPDFVPYHTQFKNFVRDRLNTLRQANNWLGVRGYIEEVPPNAP